MLKIAHHALYNHPLKENHRFPMIKYELIPEQLIMENTCVENNFFKPKIISEENVLFTHDKIYFDKLQNQQLDRKEIRAIGFPMSEKLIEREKTIVQGTVECSLNSLKYGISMNIAGGTHHAFTNRAEAFCLLNDQAIAANFLLKNNYCKKILILDLDVHQGNGTAEIFKNNTFVFTCSVHGAKNYPFRKEESDLDIAMEDKTKDEIYLKKIGSLIPDLIDQTHPDFVFYLSGVDVLGTDKLGRLDLSIEGCRKRDQIVFEILYNKGIPVQCSMGGGYSEDINIIIEAHANTYREAAKLYF